VIPWYVSVRIKSKLTQLRFNEEVVTDGAIIQRSQITGELLIKVKKLTPNHVVSNIIKKEKV
jgi:protein TilB